MNRADRLTRQILHEVSKEKLNGRVDLAEKPISKLFPYRPFPVDCFPGIIRDYIYAGSASLNCDPIFMAHPMLSALGAAVGNSFRARVKKGWSEPSIIWTVLIATSGTMKSPALELVLKPVRELELEELDRYNAKKEIYKEDLRDWRSLSKDDKAHTPRPEPPERKRYKVQDVTVEALAARHEDAPRGLIVARDELAGWIGGFNKYAGGDTDIQSWIEMYEGRHLQIDRKNPEFPTLDIRYPHVCVTGGIQPKVYKQRMSEEHFESGFAMRLLVAEPPPGERGWSDAEVSKDVYQAYRNLVRSLYLLPYDLVSPNVISLSYDARNLFKDFLNKNARFSSELPEGYLRSVLPKLEAILIRLSLILALCSSSPDVPEEIDTRAVISAMGIIEWYRHEATRLFLYNQHEERTKDKKERAFHNLPSMFRVKDVMQCYGVKKAQAHNIIRGLHFKDRVEEGMQTGVYHKTTTGNETLEIIKKHLNLNGTAKQ